MPESVKIVSGEAAAELLPDLGCNCVRWRVGEREMLFAPPLDELANRPTRGGIPILFPFPNRIKNGYFVCEGREFQLTKNDSSQQNAIHGFSTRASWKVTSAGASARAVFVCDSDLWPASGMLAIAIHLSENTLRYEAEVTNIDTKQRPFPFGLGFHPYFVSTPDCRVQTNAVQRWQLIDGIPTGRRLPLDGNFDLREGRLVAELKLDDVYTDLPKLPITGGLIERGRVEYPKNGVLRVRTSPEFRELVLFTPPHGKAVCLEPYTCPTDAIHLQERENVGWQVLQPGATWTGVVEFQWTPL